MLSLLSDLQSFLSITGRSSAYDKQRLEATVIVI